MRLLRFADAGKPKLGVLRGEEIMSLESLSGEFPTMMSVIAGGDIALARIDALKSGRTVELQGARLLAPIERPGKYLAIGMNYRKHAAEAERAGVAAPKQQLWFNKQTTCISGPYDPIEPGPTERLDYEVELGFVIGKPAKNVSEERAREHVFCYFVANDASARDWQFHSPTFTMGKSFDTHGPIGPWIVTADEVPDPHALAVRDRRHRHDREHSGAAAGIAVPRKARPVLLRRRRSCRPSGASPPRKPTAGRPHRLFRTQPCPAAPEPPAPRGRPAIRPERRGRARGGCRPDRPRRRRAIAGRGAPARPSPVARRRRPTRRPAAPGRPAPAPRVAETTCRRLVFRPSASLA